MAKEATKLTKRDTNWTPYKLQSTCRASQAELAKTKWNTHEPEQRTEGKWQVESGKWQVALGRWKTESSRGSRRSAVSAGDALGQAMTNKQRNEVEMAKRERKK